MAYDRPGEENSEYRTLAHLVEDLIDRPGELFMLDRGCEALVFVPELDQILLISAKNVLGSREVRQEVLRQKLNRIIEDSKT